MFPEAHMGVDKHATLVRTTTTVWTAATSNDALIAAEIKDLFGDMKAPEFFTCKHVPAQEERLDLNQGYTHTERVAMKRFLKLSGVLLSWFMASTFCLSTEPILPSGWRTPLTDEVQDEWRNQDSNRYLSIRADFNGDGLVDDARLLVCDEKNKLGVFAFMLQKTGTYKTVLLADDINANRYVMAMGISLIEPGTYKTACGKHIVPCGKGELEEISLKYDGINYFKEGSASRYFYWDSSIQSFQKAWIDD
jgi:hypothetical protein